MENPMLWVGYPKSYTKGRIRPVRFVTLHYTAGSEGPTSAENGAQYDKVRTDGTSCHAFFDSAGPGLQEVPFGDRSHTAFYKGNTIGVHYEICGTRQTREQWLDAVSLATLRTCAVAVRYACETLGLDWSRRLSVADTRRAWDVGDVTGINDHYDCTRAFPGDGGDHTDVGPDFPWDVFMDLVRDAGTPKPTQEDDMYLMWDKPKGQPAGGFLVTGTLHEGKPVVIPVSGPKVQQWIDLKIEQRWPDKAMTLSPDAWFITGANEPWTTDPNFIECECDCGDGGGEPVLVEHNHDIAGQVSIDGTTGPAIPIAA